MSKKKPGGESGRGPRRSKRSADDMPPLSPQDMQRILRQLADDMGIEIDELDAALLEELGRETVASPRPRPAKAGREETALERAEEVINDAYEAEEDQQVPLARKALEISPDCADAYVLLAHHAESMEEALDYFQQGMDAGQRVLGPKGFAEYTGAFWQFLETRPYMRAREGVARCLWELGRREEAAAHFQDMLRLNPNDNQGARYSLVTLLLDLDRDGEVQQLLEQYDKDSSAEWAYSRALLAFRQNGESAEAARLLKRAMKVNKRVPAYLLGHASLPRELPDYITRGGKDEAISYAAGNRRVWLNTAGAVTWLRKTLDAPLPKARKPRPPAWSRVKAALLRLPQVEDDAWLVDTFPAPLDESPEPAVEPQWLLVIAGRSGQELLEADLWDVQPSPAELWEVVVETMRQPREGDARRPAAILVSRPDVQAAWTGKLAQLGVRCELSDDLHEIEAIRNHLMAVLPALSAEHAEGPAVAEPDDLAALPQMAEETWQADMRPLLTWITGEGQPYRPWVILVIDDSHDIVLAHDIFPERPSGRQLWQTLARAVQRPALGQPHRPALIQLADERLRDDVEADLRRAGMACGVQEKLEHLDAVFDDMTRHMGGPKTTASLLEVPGMRPEMIGSFYAAAAEFYRARPWQHVQGDTAIRIECDKFQSGPWYGFVMGQSGIQQGLAVYEDMDAIREMIAGTAAEEASSRKMSGFSVMFGEAFEIPPAELDAAQRQGWPVAGPEAYPLVLRVNPGHIMRPPLVWELELLEGCLRAIPAFLLDSGAAARQDVATAAGQLPLRLSWLEG